MTAPLVVPTVTQDSPEIADLHTIQDKLVAQALALEVVDDSSAEAAVNLAKMLKSIKTTIESKRRGFVDPLNQTVKNINALFKKLSEGVDDALLRLTARVLAYQSEKAAAAREEAEAIQKQLDAQAVATGAAPVTVVPVVEKRVEAAGGTFTMRKVRVYRIEDKAAFLSAVARGDIPARVEPDEAFSLDGTQKDITVTVSMRKLISGGQQIPGVAVFEREEGALR